MIRFLVLLLTTLPSAAIASEGLALAGIYHCNAIQITSAIVKSCSSRQPELHAHLFSAYTAWFERFGDAAAERAKECVAYFKNSPDGLESQQVRATIQKNVAMLLEQIEQKIEAEGC